VPEDYKILDATALGRRLGRGMRRKVLRER
jgi:hypothetical protein